MELGRPKENGIMKSLWNRRGLTLGVWLLFGISIILFASCTEEEEPAESVPVESVTLSSSSLTLGVGETATLTATVLPDYATVQTLVWSSSNQSVATVSDKGVVTAVAAGEATVTVVADDQSAVCMVVVNDGTAPDDPIVIDGEKADMNLDCFTTPQEVAEAIRKADEEGVKQYVLFGSFDKLGIGTEVNPFKESRAETIDMSYVTGWPMVEVETVSCVSVLEGLPGNAFGREETSSESPLKEVILPECVRIVGPAAFRNCTNLQKVKMRGVKVVGIESFSACFSLSQVEAPLLETIGTGAFQDCDSWEKVYLPSVREVGEDAFYACDKNLKELDMPEAVTLGEDAFKDCTFLEKVNFPKVEVIGMNAFTYDFCEKPVELVFPSAKTVVRQGFYDCEKLYRLVLPKVTSIGDYAFHNCYELTSLELTTSEEINIGESTFSDFEPSACHLVLNSNKQTEVKGNVWKGITWKEISFAD